MCGAIVILNMHIVQLCCFLYQKHFNCIAGYSLCLQNYYKKLHSAPLSVIAMISYKQFPITSL